MADDLVERLRDRANAVTDGPMASTMYRTVEWQAAEEIDSLRADLAAAERVITAMHAGTPRHDRRGPMNPVIEAMESAFNAAERMEDRHPLQAALRAALEATGYNRKGAPHQTGAYRIVAVLSTAAYEGERGDAE